MELSPLSPPPLIVIHFDSRPDGSGAVRRSLKLAGLTAEVRRVDDGARQAHTETLTEALGGVLDVVVVSSLPRAEARGVLDVLAAHVPQLPVVFFGYEAGEPEAYEAVERLCRSGAARVDNPAHLALVVRRLLEGRGTGRALSQCFEALRREARQFRLAFEYGAVGMAVLGPDERFLEVNPAFCQMLGYSADEFLRLGAADVTHPDDHAADLALLITMAALRRSESRGGHYRADYPDEDPKQAMRALVMPGAAETVRVGS